jgi:hypothetical protein
MLSLGLNRNEVIELRKDDGTLVLQLFPYCGDNTRNLAINAPANLKITRRFRRSEDENPSVIPASAIR